MGTWGFARPAGAAGAGWRAWVGGGHRTHRCGGSGTKGLCWAKPRKSQRPPGDAAFRAQSLVWVWGTERVQDTPLGGELEARGPGPSPHHQLHSPLGTWGASGLGSKCPEADSSLRRQTGKTLVPCVMGQEEQPQPPRPSASLCRGLCHQSPSPGQLSLPCQ